MLIIPVHSFSGLITNSSSETFIASTDKSVEAVKDILQSILDKFNADVPARKQKEVEEYGHAYSREVTFAECFGEIFVSPVSFKFDGLSDTWVTHPEDKDEEWPRHLPLMETDPEFDRLTSLHEAWKERAFTNYRCYKKFPTRRKHQHRWMKKSNVAMSIVRRNEEKVFADFTAKWRAHDMAIVKKNFDDNGLDFNEFFVTPKKNSWHRKLGVGLEFNTEKDPLITKVYEFCFYWHQEVKKGDILITSTDDNSIPYSLWDEINSTLNARNVHCG